MNTIIIVAGGIGSRMNSEVPKQFMLLGKEPILIRAIKKFIEYDKSMEIILTIPQNQLQQWKKLCSKYNFNIDHKISFGGITRFHSVKNALEKVDPKSHLVGIHDGVRPLVSVETITNCYKTANEKGNAVPILQINESVRRINEKDESQIINRNGIYLMQTPQVFTYNTIINAYKQAYSTTFTDDASVVEQTGEKIFFTEGNRENIKITFPDDIDYAKKLI